MQATSCELVSVVSLTVMVPVCVTRLFAIYHDIFAGKVVLLPVTVPSGHCQPPGISMAAPVIPVDEEVTLAQSYDGKDIPGLGFDVKPGAVSKSGDREPVQLV